MPACRGIDGAVLSRRLSAARSSEEAPRAAIRKEGAPVGAAACVAAMPDIVNQRRPISRRASCSVSEQPDDLCDPDGAARHGTASEGSVPRRSCGLNYLSRISLETESVRRDFVNGLLTGSKAYAQND